ncbi:hypothetical protein HPB47_020730 [Ixodes persulcatus]|uniref:Uncharacterized protein n=1 Tax=Ixodes persulcatus TaxID=34615 RepID=A0AC60QET0_IXOPE|nr:hypothetical protein HPB47_020730 [Ixodes persulcatus]
MNYRRFVASVVISCARRNGHLFWFQRQWGRWRRGGRVSGWPCQWCCSRGLAITPSWGAAGRNYEQWRSTEVVATEGASAIPAKRQLSGSYSKLSENEAGNEDASMGHTEDNDDDFKTVDRRKKKTKRSSQHSQGKANLCESSQTVLVVPTQAEMNLRNLNWQRPSDEL